jgi:cytochrome c oxidase subunit 2
MSAAHRAWLAAVSIAPIGAIASPAHDALRAAGPQAAHIADLWWLTLGVCAFVFVAVLAALAWALWRTPRSDAGTPADAAPAPAAEKRIGRRVTVAVTISSVLLIGLLIASVMTDRALAHLSLDDALHVQVTAHQWWWTVTYDDRQPERIFTTANELYVPVGRPVLVTLHSDDVIHSFWVPSLHGKKDLIPGRVATIQFRADQPGEYLGECAEFCGLQHAFMAFDVVALAPAQFEAWADAHRKPAAEPEDAAARRGRDLFLSGSCMLCHAIQGTSANAHKAPDLTHFASRARIGAGRLPNTPANLAAWIADPQKIKPGVNMPAHLIPGDDLGALVAYLGTLR